MILSLDCVTLTRIALYVINLPRPKIVYLDGWEEWELFLDGLDKAC